MRTPSLTQELVISRSRSLPSFPAIVTDILATLDDPDGNLNALVRAINLDPLISARVLSVANTVALRGTRESEVCDINTATSLIGMNRVRHITMISSLSTFVAGAARSGLPPSFWQHSVAAGVCCEELALPVPSAMALITGLLHDIGQLWLYHVDAAAVQVCWREATARAIGIEAVEREHFGIDHSTIGAWLAQHWGLPAPVVVAIGGHHQPESAMCSPLVSLMHVAEVLSNALDLAGRQENRVTYLSALACKNLGLVWADDIKPLFGRIEARSRHMNAFFSMPHPLSL
jgi:HD-like signal output (HDOD) protein